MTIAPPTTLRTRGKTLFITFYSFKGGVGRTMSLVNAACILAARGRRVLLIDFDLEAPGLTTLKDLASKDGLPQHHPGLVELIHDFLRDPKTSALTDKANKTRFHDEYVCSLEIPSHLERIEGGRLDLMPCGRMDETYGKRLNAIKFDQIYEAGIGQPLFKLLKSVVQQSGLYDYVLIDSRTGFSDEGGICTRDLADHIFVVMGLNRQNVDGTVRFLHSLNRSGWKEGRVFFVVSPMPVFYEELRDIRLADARQQIEATGYKTDLKLHIPYHPRLSLDEEPFVYHWSETNLFDAYRRIQGQIRQLNNNTPQTWWEEAIKAIRTNQFEQALHLLDQIKVEDSDFAVPLLSIITNQMVEDVPELKKHIDPFFAMWIQILGENTQILKRYGDVLTDRKDYEQADVQLNRALTLAAEQSNKAQMADVLLSLGNLAVAQYQQEQAQSLYDKALSIYKEVDQQAGIAITYALLGNVYSNVGMNKKSLRHYGAARGIFEQLEQQRNTAQCLYHIAGVYMDLGAYDQALGSCKAALKLLEEINDRSLAAAIDITLGDICHLRSDDAEALRLYKQSQQVFDSIQDCSGIAQVNHRIADVYQSQGKFNDALICYETALDIYKKENEKLNLYATLGEIGRTKFLMNDVDGALETIEQANISAEQIGAVGVLAEGRVDYAEALYHKGTIEAAKEYLGVHWNYIQRYAPAHAKAEARVLHAKISRSLGDTITAKADLQAALDFYKAQQVHTALAKEAEELAASLATL